MATYNAQTLNTSDMHNLCKPPLSYRSSRALAFSTVFTCMPVQLHFHFITVVISMVKKKHKDFSVVALECPNRISIAQGEIS